MGQGGEGLGRQAGLTVLHLQSLLPAATLARWLAALDRQPGGSLRLAEALDMVDVLQALRPLHALLVQRLGPAPQVVVSQCWVRRAHPAHSWHQDGALHHDFAAPAQPLPMWTAWLPLVDCGVDAPGLAWMLPSLPRLLSPAELQQPSGAVQSPPLAAGDLLLFDGGLLHRSHSTPAMTQPRTSIELRCIAAGTAPDRLRGETLRPWP